MRPNFHALLQVSVPFLRIVFADNLSLLLTLAAARRALARDEFRQATALGLESLYQGGGGRRLVLLLLVAEYDELLLGNRACFLHVKLPRLLVTAHSDTTGASMGLGPEPALLAHAHVVIVGAVLH